MFSDLVTYRQRTCLPWSWQTILSFTRVFLSLIFNKQTKISIVIWTMSTVSSLLCLIVHITAINSKSYIIGSEELNWHNSKTFCLLFGTNLASIHSESDFNETRRLCNDTNFGNCWVGLNDIDSEGVWNGRWKYHWLWFYEQFKYNQQQVYFHGL